MDTGEHLSCRGHGKCQFKPAEYDIAPLAIGLAETMNARYLPCLLPRRTKRKLKASQPCGFAGFSFCLKWGLPHKSSHIGDPGVYLALSDAGIINNPIDPDFVIVGETSSYNYDSICHAVDLVNKGARLIGTNTDLTCPVENGIVPACRALISPIEMATGKQAYFVGKPNPLMMRTGLRILGVHSQDAAIIGDRMDTDIIAGVESGLDTCLVLSGCTSREDVLQHPFRPRLILNGVGDIVG